MLDQIDHTDQIMMRTVPLLVASTDRCNFFKRRRDTIFNGNDCWHCKYGEFGIDTDTPDEEGYCKYNEALKISHASLKRASVEKFSTIENFSTDSL